MTRRLSFVSLPFAGHLYPLIPLAQAAQAAGYAVEVVTGEAKQDVLRQAGLEVRVLKAIGPGVFKSIFNTGGEFGRSPLRIFSQLEAGFAFLRAVRDELADAWRAERPDLVVADFASVPAGIAADQLAIPWITVLRGGFFLESREAPPPFLGGLAPRPGLVGPVRDAAGRSAIRRGKAALSWLFRRDLALLGFNWRRPDGSESMFSDRAILIQDMAELEFPRAWPAAVHFIGPQPDNPEPPLGLELPANRPRVLVTLGTHLRVAKRGLVEQVRALAQRSPGVQFVVSMGDAGGRSPTPSHSEPGLAVFPFIPYREEVAGFDAVIHHAGPGIIGAAVAAAKPSLMRPHVFDQFDFAARVEHHGLGLRVRDIASDEAAAKLARLLKAPWPALPIFAAAAARYRPVDSFLETVAEHAGPAGPRSGAQ